MNNDKLIVSRFVLYKILFLWNSCLKNCLVNRFELKINVYYWIYVE